MLRFRHALPFLASLLLSAHSLAAPLTMGMVGDSLTDDYLGGPKPANNDLAAYSWGQVLAELRPNELDFGAYKPMGDLWDENIRYSGYEHNWATSGGVASNKTKLYAMGIPFSVTIFGASYLSSQTAGLAQRITNGDISTAFVGIGTNDFFYRVSNFDSSGNYVPSDRPIDDAFVNDIASSILTGVDTLRNAGTGSGHPVDIVLGLLPAGTAGGISIPILDGINAVNQKLVDGAATRGIPTVDLFAWATDKTRVDSNGTLHIGQLAIGIDGAASDIDIGPDGKGPCDSTGCALPTHANHFRADDGLHPNTVIQALIANEILKKLNSHYGRKIPLITDAEILELVGVPLPAACQQDTDKDGTGYGDYSFVEGACPPDTVAIPLVSDTVRLGATPDADNCPWLANPKQSDSDSNGVGNACEGDFDSDKIPDATDNCRAMPNTDQLNNDGDDGGNACDDDDDNDGYADNEDAFPLDPDEYRDSDGDGLGDNSDNCPVIANASQLDTDRDNEGDACDDDDDNDGVDDLEDNCPLTYTWEENQDNNDGDAQGNACDDDDDNDGVKDSEDAFPFDASETTDTDGDNIGDNSDPLPANDDLLNAFNGAAGKDRRGTAVAFAGDVDGDGKGDYAIGIPGHDLPATPGSKAIKDAGRAEVISGRTGTVLMEINGSSAKAALGSAIAGNVDIDGDGHLDVVVGAPGADGAVILFGPDGLRKRILSGEQKKSAFGAALALGDLDGDGKADVAVGAPREKDVEAKLVGAGSVTVFDAGDDEATVIIKHRGTTAKEAFGSSVATGNIDADNNADLVVGSPLADANNMKDSGSITVFSGTTTNAIYSKAGLTSRALFGTAIAVGDVGSDDSMDVLVGAPGEAGTGSITGFSGDTGTAFFKQSGSAAGDGMGYSVAIGDVDDDYLNDVIGGAWKADIKSGKTRKDAGSITAWHADGSTVMDPLSGAAAKDYYGAALASGDVNDDGKDDLIIGIPGADIPGAKLLKDAGRVEVLSVASEIVATRKQVIEGLKFAIAAQTAVQDGYAANDVTGVITAAKKWNKDFPSMSPPASVLSVSIDELGLGVITITYDKVLLPLLSEGKDLKLTPHLYGIVLTAGYDPIYASAIVWACAGATSHYAGNEGLVPEHGNLEPLYAPEECR